jgi:beta-glucanase (GH16 family)
MWFGNVQATFKTSRGAGVVTAFILLSDVKDEIDYEFVGADLESAQSNYYFQGIPNCEYMHGLASNDHYTNLKQMIMNLISLFRTHLITITLTK